MEFLIAFAAAAACGTLSALGIGGGTLLIIYMSFASALSQQEMQGYNLLYFFAVAVTSLIFHIKNKLIEYRAALWMILAGLPTTVLGAMLAFMIDPGILRKLFGVMLFYIGFTMLLDKKEKRKA